MLAISSGISVKCRFFGTTPCCSDKIAFIRPTAPDPDWLVLRHPDGSRALAFQQIPDYVAPTWPGGPHPQMLHLDTVVPTIDELFRHRDRALALGAAELLDRSADAEEPLFVLADPAGHPFCVFVADIG